jgi:hypothetical protein
MKNNDIVNLKETYYKVISRGNNQRLLKEDENSDKEIDDIFGTSIPTEDETQNHEMPNLKDLPLVKGMKPMLTNLAMTDLNTAWDENSTKKSEKNKNTLIFFGEPSTGKTEGIYNFCNEKAIELGLDTRAIEINKQIKNTEEYKNNSDNTKEEKNINKFNTFIDFTKLPSTFKTDAALIKEIRNGNIFTLFQVNGDQVIPMEILGVPNLLDKEEKTGDEEIDKLNKLKYNIKNSPMTLAMQGNTRGIFFIDEFNRAQNDNVYNLFIKLFDEGLWGDNKISNNITVCGAGNLKPHGKASGGVKRDVFTQEALITRIRKYFVYLDATSWFDYAEKKNFAEDIIGFIAEAPYKRLGLQNQNLIKDTVDETAMAIKNAPEWEQPYPEESEPEAKPSPRAIERFNNWFKKLNFDKSFAKKYKKVIELNIANVRNPERDAYYEKIKKYVGTVEGEVTGLWKEEVIKAASAEMNGKWADAFWKYLQDKGGIKIENLRKRGADYDQQSWSRGGFSIPFTIIPQTVNKAANAFGTKVGDVYKPDISKLKNIKPNSNEERIYNDIVAVLETLDNAYNKNKQLMAAIIPRLKSKGLLVFLNEFANYLTTNPKTPEEKEIGILASQILTQYVNDKNKENSINPDSDEDIEANRLEMEENISTNLRHKILAERYFYYNLPIRKSQYEELKESEYKNLCRLKPFKTKFENLLENYEKIDLNKEETSYKLPNLIKNRIQYLKIEKLLHTIQDHYKIGALDSNILRALKKIKTQDLIKFIKDFMEENEFGPITTKLIDEVLEDNDRVVSILYCLEDIISD